MNKKELPIGVFDSGLGGLNVLSWMRRIMPRENFIYLGDTAHLPYGIKSSCVIQELTVKNLLFLMRKNVKLIVVACNTTSAVALENISGFFSVPVLGVVFSGVKAALNCGKSRFGIIGTNATIKSRAYQDKIKSARHNSKVIAVSCPLFVPLVEEGIVKGKIAEDVARMYLGRLKGSVDALILGCTHYPLLSSVISRVLPGVEIIDSSFQVAKDVKHYLARMGCCVKAGKQEKQPYF